MRGGGDDDDDRIHYPPPASRATAHGVGHGVKIVLNLAAEKRGKCTEFPRLGTNRTQLQLVKSCAFLLDPGVPISKCQSAEVHLDFPMQIMCATVRSYIGISDVRMIKIKARVYITVKTNIQTE